MEHPSANGNVDGDVLVQWVSGQPKWGVWWVAVCDWSGTDPTPELEVQVGTTNHSRCGELWCQMLAHGDVAFQDLATVLSTIDPEIAQQVKAVSEEERNQLLQAVGGLTHEMLPSHYDAVDLMAIEAGVTCICRWHSTLLQCSSRSQSEECGGIPWLRLVLNTIPV